jgi:hypothetical protein
MLISIRFWILLFYETKVHIKYFKSSRLGIKECRSIIADTNQLMAYPFTETTSVAQKYAVLIAQELLQGACVLTEENIDTN